MADPGSGSGRFDGNGVGAGPDRIEGFGTARIQHGRRSDRVYIMDVGREEPARLAQRAEELAEDKNYGKLFAKVPASAAAAFFAAGWRMEAFVPGMFRAGAVPEAVPGAGSPEREDGLFVVKYPSPEREDAARSPGNVQLMERFSQLLRTVGPRPANAPAPAPARGIRIRPCRPEDAGEMASVFARVFSGYPFPVDDPAFIRESMGEGTDYLCAVSASGPIVAVSSAERNERHRHAEMTDFAVLPECRGAGLSGALLSAMEERAADGGLRCLYTIARLRSAGMNATFLKAGYRYGGTLYANTAMPEGLESMNVLYRCPL